MAWISVEGIFTLGALGYETYKMGFKPEEAMEKDLQGYATTSCHFPILSEEILGNDEFGTLVKKRVATMDCSQLPAPMFHERLEAR